MALREIISNFRTGTFRGTPGLFSYFQEKPLPTRNHGIIVGKILPVQKLSQFCGLCASCSHCFVHKGARTVNSNSLHTGSRRFSGLTALVTGGTGALGSALVDAILEEGGNVAFTYATNEKKASEIMGRTNADRTASFQCDVRDHEAAQNILDSVVHRWSRIDFLINNASIVHDKLFVSMSLADWQSVLDTTLLGAFSFTRPTVSRMLRQGKGSILNIASISAIKGVRGQANYSTAKAGLLGLTRSLAVELAPHNIRVNAVLPGLMEQGMGAALSKARLEDIKSQIPLRRLCSPAEIARLCIFLLSDDASYVTGQCIGADGGLSAL